MFHIFESVASLNVSVMFGFMLAEPLRRIYGSGDIGGDSLSFVSMHKFFSSS